MNQITETCLRYLDGDLNEEEAKAFDELIAAPPKLPESWHAIDR